MKKHAEKLSFLCNLYRSKKDVESLFKAKHSAAKLSHENLRICGLHQNSFNDFIYLPLNMMACPVALRILEASTYTPGIGTVKHRTHL